MFTLFLLPSCGAITYRIERQCLIREEWPQPTGSGVTNSCIVSDRASTLRLFSGFQRPVMGGVERWVLKTLGQDRGLRGSRRKERFGLQRLNEERKGPSVQLPRGQMLPVTRRGQSSAEPLVAAHSGFLWIRWDEPPPCLFKWHPDQ